MERWEERWEDGSGFRWPGAGADFEWGKPYREPDTTEAPDKGWQSIGALATEVIDSVALAVELGSLCESPIEIDLAVKLTRALRVIDDPTLSLGHQFKLERYRYDLSILREGRTKPLLLIECDGKEFHSAEDRKATDRAKDALARREGILLLRFSGSEIFRDLDACTRVALKALRLNASLTQRDWDALELAKVV